MPRPYRNSGGQWRNAKIIPLKKPNKPDYRLPKAWRPISLLSTLGKALEAVIAERISYLVETYGLLPANHFGARKQRSAEQTLVLLQEYIYDAWRQKRVVSLLSFDVKGAYNGVFKQRLLQRLTARGIPPVLVRWVDAFCSSRTATIVVNGHCSERQGLAQAGLPQGSPLSPILFLFFNADLVQRRLDRNGGSIAFVDDAMAWEKRSGATFESDKTVLVHFTRNADRTDERPITIKEQDIHPAKHAKTLGVVMKEELRYRQHIARAGAKGLDAAMALRRLKSLSPTTARRLFEAMVAPVVDYASIVWMHACTDKLSRGLHRVQKVGAQAVIGCFRTVATVIAETEASIPTVKERHNGKATRLWINLRTLERSHPLSRLGLRVRKRYKSPLQKVAETHRDISPDGLETIRPFAVAPWHPRLLAVESAQEVEAMTNATGNVQVWTSSSAKNGKVGMGGVIGRSGPGTSEQDHVFSCTLGTRTSQNPYTAALMAIAEGLARLGSGVRSQSVQVFARNRGAVLASARPKAQSGQAIIRQIYEEASRLGAQGSQIRLAWVPAVADERATQAKEAARAATADERTILAGLGRAKSTVLSTRKRRTRKDHTFTSDVGRFTREMDAALPGKHTRALYGSLTRKQASVLAQLRTGMARLNGYLHRIGAVESEQCSCGHSQETVEHFLLRCTKWDTPRRERLAVSDTGRTDLSFYLGGKGRNDPANWKPNMDAVQATIKFAIATGRLDAEVQHPPC